MSLRDKIFAGNLLPKKEVIVRGCKVFVRAMTLAEHQGLAQLSRNKDDADIRADIVMLATVDETGERVFTEADRPQIENLDLKSVNAIVEAFWSVNGVTKEAIEEAEKN